MSHSEPDAEIAIRVADRADMACLSAALAQLSADLGDTHRTTAAQLGAACLGAPPSCHGLLALRGDVPVGAALVSPVFSTTQGAAGAYVSDLWVAGPRRGAGLGRRLLSRAAGLAARRWQGKFLKLTVYADNARARAFYESLGFRLAPQDRTLVLARPAFDALAGDAP